MCPVGCLPLPVPLCLDLADLGCGGAVALALLALLGWAWLFLALLRPTIRPRLYAQVRVLLYVRFGWPPPHAAQESRALDDLAASLADLVLLLVGIFLPTWAAMIGAALVVLA